MKFFWFYLIIHALVCKRIFSVFLVLFKIFGFYFIQMCSFVLEMDLRIIIPPIRAEVSVFL